MIHKKLELTHEQTSPLFRIMWVYNINEPTRRQFENNIVAFHIGNGYVLSVAHNLPTESFIIKSLPEEVYQTEIIPKLNSKQRHLFNECYVLDPETNKRYFNVVNPPDSQVIADTMKAINMDTRWSTLTQRGFCKPHLIVQYKDDASQNDHYAKTYANTNAYFYENVINRHTYLLEMELVEAYYQEDIALYRIVNDDKALINQLPSVEIDYSILDDDQQNFYCLQSAPNGFLGRLLNKAQIEGFLDHHGIFGDRIGGNFSFEGLRYLIKGYFRFGSSGAPYVYFDNETGKFKANAVQSEACPIQLTINNNRDGNFQYINALASPLQIIKERLEKHINS